MSDIYIFAWGTFATLLAVGPLVVALYLDSVKDKRTVPSKTDSKGKTP